MKTSSFPSIRAAITPSYVRHFPNAPFTEKALTSVDAALNERFSFQLALRAPIDDVHVAVSATAPDGWSVRVRRVGLVPVAHHNTPTIDDPAERDGIGHMPGLVPDPLFDETETNLGRNETTAFWFTVVPPEGARPGKARLSVTVEACNRWNKEKYRTLTRTLAVNLRNVAIRPRAGFDITHWFYNDCLIQRYGAEFSDERYWPILEAYLKDIAAHGQNVIYVPVFTPPLDGDKYPSQLLGVTRKGKGKYEFDWTLVRRYVRAARKCGIEKFEWCHFFAQWGCKYALRIYEGRGDGEKLLWPADTPATSETYRVFLLQFIPELEKFLREEKILSRSLFHISDEPHGEEARASYKAAREMLRSIAPWMKCMDALSEIEFGRDRIVDMPVPIINKALDFLSEGIDSWCYYCCGPRGEYLQHLMDTPLAKIAMHGFLFYRWPFKGFLHWGLNYWNRCQKRIPIDPFTVSDAHNWDNGWAYGDTFLIYPGENGPIDSIRWEVFGESLQDYALMQTIGLDRASKILAPIKSFADFPKDPNWRIAAKKRLYALAEKRG